MSDYSYAGAELDLFAAAIRWKAYWLHQLRPFVGGSVLEVGAGSGNNVSMLDELDYTQWLSLEPDAGLAARLARKLEGCPGARVVVGTLADLPGDQVFDTVLYLDVLEHIQDDGAEMHAAARRLRPGGRLIVLAPAHQWLYTPFDAAIGHYRRYARRSLRAVAPPQLRVVSMRYLDSAGLLASVANRVFLRQAMPSEAQLRVWDTYLVTLSRHLDRFLGYRLGKSILGVWQHAG